MPHVTFMTALVLMPVPEHRTVSDRYLRMTLPVIDDVTAVLLFTDAASLYFFFI